MAKQTTLLMLTLNTVKILIEMKVNMFQLALLKNIITVRLPVCF